MFSLIRFWFVIISAFIIIIPTAGHSQSETEPGYVFAPFVSRLAGVGSFYGPIIGMQNIPSSTIDLIGGKTFGRIEAAGILIAQIPISKDHFSFSAGVVQVDQMFLDISYTRGMIEDDPVTQVGNAQGAALVLHWDLFRPKVIFNTTIASWDFKFDKYLTYKEEDTLSLPGIHLGDLKSTFLINDFVLDFTDSPELPTSGFKAGINLASHTTNTQFSGTNTASYFLNAYLPIAENHTLLFRGFGSDTSVSQQKVTDPDEIKSILAVDCNQVSDAAQKADCERLKENIASYLSAHNQYGTATPLGGNKMLRSYREARFRGAHSRFMGTELRLNYPGSGFVSNYQMAIFFERGAVADDLGNLSQQTADSSGVALRLQLKDLYVRLETANGDEGAEWFFTIGNPW